jgi:hypothetical protein
MQTALKPRFKSKELDNDDCKWLLNKVTEKVLGNTSAMDKAVAGEAFMNEKRQKKINVLIDTYAMQRRMSK